MPQPKADLVRIAQLIADLQAIDTALRGLEYKWPASTGKNATAKIVVHYVNHTNTGHDQEVRLSDDEARIILEGQRRGTVGLLKVHGLTVE